MAFGFLDSDRDVFAGDVPVEFAGGHELRQEPEVHAPGNVTAEPSPDALRAWASPRGRGSEAASMASIGMPVGTLKSLEWRSRKPVSSFPPAKSSVEMTRRRNSMFVRTPRRTKSSRARVARSIAALREGAQTISFASIGSK